MLREKSEWTDPFDAIVTMCTGKPCEGARKEREGETTDF